MSSWLLYPNTPELNGTMKNTGCGTLNVRAFQSLQRGEVSAARPLGAESWAKPVSGAANRADRRDDPLSCGHGDLRLTREDSCLMVLRKDKAEIGNFS